MNHDPPSESVAAAPASTSTSTPVPDEPRDHVVPTAVQITERRKENRLNFNRKRGELLDDLLKSLDLLVYAELSAVYHMDCFFWRFFLRVMVQFIFLTPKPAIFPETTPNKPYVGAIFGSNALCLLLHALQSAPSAGEATRNYMHGGLAMDFIGQKGPTSKIHLLLLDLVILLLQLAQLSAHITRLRLKDPQSVPVPSRASRARLAPTRQDLDSEERGVRRSDEEQDIEMQNLNPSATASPLTTDPDPPDPTERESLFPPQRTDAHIFDAFNSGQIVLADLDIPHTVSEQFWAYTPAEDMDQGRIMRANITGQLLRWRIGPTVEANENGV